MFAAIDFRMVGVGQIRRNVWNSRVVGDGDADILELAESIKTEGLQQPVKLRPVARDGEVLYELVFGERRWRACVVAGLVELAAIVEEMDDDRAKTLTALENLQRRDLNALESAVSIQNLFDLGWTALQVGEHLGKPASWVARRAQLTHLIGAWRGLVQNPKQAVSKWSSGHLELIARMPETVQVELAVDFDCKDRDYNAPRDHYEVATMTDAELRRELARFCRALDGAPWKMDDCRLSIVDCRLSIGGGKKETGVAELPACDECFKRSDRQAELFDADEFGGGGKKKGKAGAMCLDAACWKLKMESHLVGKASELRAKHGDVVVVGFEREAKGSAFEGQTVEPYEMEECKKSEPGAKPALDVTERGGGRSYWVKPRGRSGGGSGSGSSLGKEKGKSGKTLAEKVVDYDWRRTRLVVQGLAEGFSRLSIVDWRLPFGEKTAAAVELPGHLGIRDMLALVSVIGTRERETWNVGYDGGKGCGKSFERYEVVRVKPPKPNHIPPEVDVIDDLAAGLFRSSCGVMEDLLRGLDRVAGKDVGGKKGLEEKQGVCRGCCGILGLSWDELWAGACMKVPYAKAWRDKAEGKGKGKAVAGGRGPKGRKAAGAAGETPGAAGETAGAASETAGAAGETAGAADGRDGRYSGYGRVFRVLDGKEGATVEVLWVGPGDWRAQVKCDMRGSGEGCGAMSDCSPAESTTGWVTCRAAVLASYDRIRGFFEGKLSTPARGRAKRALTALEGKRDWLMAAAEKEDGGTETSTGEAVKTADAEKGRKGRKGDKKSEDRSQESGGKSEKDQQGKVGGDDVAPAGLNPDRVSFGRLDYPVAVERPDDVGWAYLPGGVFAGEVLLVESGLGDTWMTFRKVIETGKRSRVKSKRLPVCNGLPTRVAAQADLDAYAVANGLVRCCRRCGCTDDAACGGGCSWVADGVCSSHLEDGSDELPDFEDDEDAGEDEDGPFEE